MDGPSFIYIFKYIHVKRGETKLIHRLYQMKTKKKINDNQWSSLNRRTF